MFHQKYRASDKVCRQQESIQRRLWALQREGTWFRQKIVSNRLLIPFVSLDSDRLATCFGQMRRLTFTSMLYTYHN